MDKVQATLWAAEVKTTRIMVIFAVDRPPFMLVEILDGYLQSPLKFSLQSEQLANRARVGRWAGVDEAKAIHPTQS